jgi:SAM-dependent methyltransferase
MQHEKGIRRILANATIYDLFQDMVGANAWRRQFIKDHVRPREGDKFIDIGCGPAQMLKWLPPVNYIGFDISETYINHARKKYGGKGTFLVGTASTLKNEPCLKEADIVMCCGVLHHLNDDEAVDVIAFAYDALKTGGRFVTMDPVYVDGQSRMSKWFVSKDRGQNVRHKDAYEKLAASKFKTLNLITNLHPIHIPNACLIMECTK